MRLSISVAALVSYLAAVAPSLQPNANTSIEGQYSSMIIEKESGDFAGYDVRVFRSGETYDITLYCSEGGLIGPVKGELRLRQNVAVLVPAESGCGKKIQLQFTPKGIFITTEFISHELIPRHKNYLKEEHWK